MKSFLRALLASLLLSSPALAQIGAGPTPSPGLQPGGGVATGHIQLNSLDVLAKVASAARFNNPRVNPVMAVPPVITQSGSANGALTNSYLWNGTNVGAMNFYGGALTTDGVGYAKFLVATISGSSSAYLWRVETKTDALKVQYHVLNISACILNWIVDGQYVSQTVTTVNAGSEYVTLDFTAAGGRQPHDIIMESQLCDFGGIYTLPTESIYNPGGTTLRAYVIGDSLTNSGGMNPIFVGWFQIFCDLLGIRDAWNGAIGGVGYVTNAFSRTCLSTVTTDIVAAAPNIIFLTCGHDDTTVSTEQAAVLTGLKLIRAQPTLATVPIVVFTVMANLTTTGTNGSANMETAIAAAVTKMNDPLIFFMSDVNNAQGAIITGTGCIGGTTGTGNADIYMNTDCVHLNGQNYGNNPEMGHWYLAQKWADRLMQQVIVP